MKSKNSQAGYVATMDFENVPAAQASIFSAITKKLSDFFTRTEYKPVEPPQYLFGKLASEEKLRLGFTSFR